MTSLVLIPFLIGFPICLLLDRAPPRSANCLCPSLALSFQRLRLTWKQFRLMSKRSVHCAMRNRGASTHSTPPCTLHYKVLHIKHLMTSCLWEFSLPRPLQPEYWNLRPHIEAHPNQMANTAANVHPAVPGNF